MDTFSSKQEQEGKNEKPDPVFHAADYEAHMHGTAAEKSNFSMVSFAGTRIPEDAGKT